MKIQKVIIFLTVLALGSVLLTAATSSEDALNTDQELTLTGFVTDTDTNEGIEGAEVVLEEAELSTTTDEYGSFSFTGLEEGTYKVTVEAEGYQSASEEAEVTEDGATVEVYLVPESK